MRPAASVLVLSLGAAMLFGQVAAPGDEKGSISGTVINVLTGGPVSRAKVTVRIMAPNNMDSYVAESDAEGKFTVSQLPAGRCMLMVQKPGFFTPQIANLMRESYPLGAGEKKGQVRLQLMPAGSITGRVLDSDGQPMPDVGVATIPNAGSAMTDEEGRYRIGGLNAGRYAVMARVSMEPSPPEHRVDGTEEAIYGNTFYPGVTRASEAGKVQVAGGAEVAGVDIRMARIPPGHVSGVVMGIPEGTGAAVMVEAPDTPMTPVTATAMVRPDGHFDLWRLPPGRYSLIARGGGPGMMLASAPVPLEMAGAEVSNIEMRVHEARAVRGRIKWDSGPPKDPVPAPNAPSNATGSGASAAQPPARQTSLNFMQVGSSMGFMSATVKDDVFTVENVFPGKYRINCNETAAFVKAVESGDQRVSGDIVDLSTVSANDELIVTLSTETGSLAGTVFRGMEPLAGASIQLISEGSRFFGGGATASRQDGTFAMPSVKPGTYKLAAWGPGSAPSYTADSADAVVDVTVAAGEKKTGVEVKIKPEGQ